MLKQVLLILFLTSLSQASSINTNTHVDLVQGSSRALMATKVEGWRNFYKGDSSCVSVIKNGAICGWTSVSAGVKCAWSYVKCVVPKCSKCCGKKFWKWACSPCKCSWDCSKKTCKEEFKKVGKQCSIATDGCVKAFNQLSSATKKFFENVGSKISHIAGKIRKAASWVAEKTWAGIRWVWDQIKKFLDLIKFFEVVKAIGAAFRCFGKLGSASTASRNTKSVKNIAQSQGKNGIISRIDSYIPGFKAFVCCMQSTAIGKVLNKWGQSLKNFRRGWSGLKVGSFLDDPAIVVSLAASVAAGNAAGTSLDIAISTAFNIGLYWTICAGWVTDIGAGVSIVVNLFRKFSFIPGQSIAVSFSIGIKDTPIGAGAGVVLPIGTNSIDFGAVNVEVGMSNGIAPAAIGGFVCDTIKLVEFNLLELIGNILTANNECPTSVRIPVNNNNVEVEMKEAATEEVNTDRRLITKTILESHKEKLSKNIEKELRDELRAQENARKLLIEEEQQTSVVGSEEAIPIKFEWQKIDTIRCGPNNLAAMTYRMKKTGIDRLIDRVIVGRLCSNTCQKHKQNEVESDNCEALRAKACERRLLGSRFNSIKKCCQMLDDDPEDLIFHVRKLCAVRGAVTKPTKSQFCEATKRSAQDLQNNFDLVNTILDGCAANYSPKACLLLKGTRDAETFSRVAKRLCAARTTSSGSSDYQFGGVHAAVIGFGFAVTLIAFVGIEKLRRNKNDSYASYEQVPDF